MIFQRDLGGLVPLPESAPVPLLDSGGRPWEHKVTDRLGVDLEVHPLAHGRVANHDLVFALVVRLGDGQPLGRGSNRVRVDDVHFAFLDSGFEKRLFEFFLRFLELREHKRFLAVAVAVHRPVHEPLHLGADPVFADFLLREHRGEMAPGTAE